MRVLFGFVAFTMASLCEAHVEKQFQLPDFLRQPFFDVEIEEGPLVDLESANADRVVSINHIGRPLKCLLPEKPTNATLEPLTDAGAIAEARKILQNYKHTAHMHLDDVWGWNFKFDENIVQFFPEEGPEPGVFHLSSSSFQVYIGKNDDVPGHVSLDDAEPVIIDDQYMLHTRFVNGTMCDLTLEPRTANVFFACSPDASPSVPAILSIDEPYSCAYEFVIGLRELCDVKAFNTPKLHVNTIRCGADPTQVVEEPNNEEDGDGDLEYQYVDLGLEQLSESVEHGDVEPTEPEGKSARKDGFDRHLPPKYPSAEESSESVNSDLDDSNDPETPPHHGLLEAEIDSVFEYGDNSQPIEATINTKVDKHDEL